MRTGITVEVSAADRQRLAAIVSDRNSRQKHVWRAEIVLLTADGCGTDKATNWINQPSCGPANPAPGSHFSFFNPTTSGLGTNISPQPPGGTKTAFPWNPRKPYAQGGTTSAPPCRNRAGTGRTEGI